MPESTEADVRERLLAALDRANKAEIEELARGLPSFELAAVLPSLDRPGLRALNDAVGDEAMAEILSQLDPALAARLIARLSSEAAADVLEEMPPDEAADVVGELRERDRDSVLRHMEAPDAADVRQLLSYPPETAGGRMTTDYYALREDMTVDEALRYLRSVREHAEFVSYLYVTDARGHLAGVVSLHDLVVSPPDRRIAEITSHDVVFVEAQDDQEHSARLLREKGLLALPVVDADRRLIGVITADDMADVMVEEASEDIERLGGSQPLEEPYLAASVWHLFRKRILWLLALFAAEAYTGSVLRFYEGELSSVVALAFFIPLLIGTGGNTGSQTVTMLVRAMALGEVQLRDIGRVILREVAVAMLLGLAMGIAAFGRAWTLGVPELGEVVAITAMCIVVWAALVAAVLPLALRQLRVDPAVVSAPLITTLVDGTGLVIYFQIAKAVLRL
jgi:magnesium transporter